VDQRPDDHVAAVVGDELGGIVFSLPPKNRLRKNVAMTSSR
jgi:hypothetical protein